MERMTPDTDKREGLGEGIYAKFVQNYEKLLEENRKLKDEIRFLEQCLDNKEILNAKYREEIKDHQLYEEKLEHRIIEFEELLHGE